MKNDLEQIGQLLHRLNMEEHAAHYAFVFSGHRTRKLEELNETEILSLIEYLQKYADKLITPLSKM